MTKRSLPTSAGAVFEVDTPAGVGYVQYLGQHPRFGDVIRVADRVERISSDHLLVHGGYIAFYPARAALRAKLLRYRGHSTPTPLPRRVRRPGARRPGRPGVLTWIIEDEAGQRLARTLTADEAALPIARIWNHEWLVSAISEGWRPELEEARVKRLGGHAPQPRSHPSSAVVHYLYFPTQSSAERAATAVSALGLETSVRRAAVGRQWLLLAQREDKGDLEGGAKDQPALARIALDEGGEYDGHEVRSGGEGGRAVRGAARQK